MNSILENIATQIGSAHLIANKNALTRESCRADLTGLPTDKVVVDMDAVFPSGQPGQKQCDYVIFFLNTSEDTCFAVPIELKRGGIKGARAQLQQGADFAARYVPRGCKTICVPILFHQSSGRRPHALAPFPVTGGDPGEECPLLYFSLTLLPRYGMIILSRWQT